MSSRLAIEPIELAHGGNTVRLVPSLRAALVLERKHDPAHLYSALATGNLQIIEDIIAAGSDLAKARAFIGAVIADRGLKALFSFNDKLVNFVDETFDMNVEVSPGNKAAPSEDEPISLKEALIDLFEIGTGWLGWTPAETYAATPAEITVAIRSHVAKLKAIHGGPEDDKPQTSDDYTAEDLEIIDHLGYDPKFDRSAVRSFAAKINGGFA